MQKRGACSNVIHLLGWEIVVKEAVGEYICVVLRLRDQNLGVRHVLIYIPLLLSPLMMKCGIGR